MTASVKNDLLKKLILASRSANCPQTSSLLAEATLKQINKQFKVSVKGEPYKTSCMLEACKGTLPKHSRVAWLVMERFEQILKKKKGKNGLENPAFLVDDKDLPPIYYACISEKLDVMKKVFEASHADINYIGANLETPLHWCCRVRFVEGINYLLEKDANILAKNQDGILPIELLLANNQDSEEDTDFEFKDSLSMATFIREKNLHEVIPMLLPSDEQTRIDLFSKLMDNDITILHAVASCDVDEGMIKHFLSEGASAMVPDCNGYTPVHVACFLGKLQNLEELFEEFEEKKDTCGLRLAITAGHFHIVDYLLQIAKYEDSEINFDELQNDSKSADMKIFLRGIALHSKERNKLIKHKKDVMEQATMTGNIDVLEFALINSAVDIQYNIAVIKNVIEMHTIQSKAVKDSHTSQETSPEMEKSNYHDGDSPEKNNEEYESSPRSTSKKGDSNIIEGRMQSHKNSRDPSANTEREGSSLQGKDRGMPHNDKQEIKDASGLKSEDSSLQETQTSNKIEEDFQDIEKDGLNEDMIRDNNNQNDKNFERGGAKSSSSGKEDDKTEAADHGEDVENKREDNEKTKKAKAKKLIGRIYSDLQEKNDGEGEDGRDSINKVQTLAADNAEEKENISDEDRSSNYRAISLYIKGIEVMIMEEIPKLEILEKSLTEDSITLNDKVVINHCLAQIEEEANIAYNNEIMNIIADFDHLTEAIESDNPEYAEIMNTFARKLDDSEASFNINERGIFTEVKLKLSSLLQHHLNDAQIKSSNHKFQEYVQHSIFHLVATEVGRKWKQLVLKLFKNYPKWYKEQMIKELRNTHDDPQNRVYDVLMRWKAVTTDEPLPLYVLTDALESPEFGMADVSHELKKKMSLAIDKETLAKEKLSEPNLSDLASRLSGDGKNVIAQLGLDEEDDVWLENNPKESVYNMLLEWNNNLRGSHIDNVGVLADACSKAHRNDLVELLTVDLQNADGISNLLLRTVALGITAKEWRALGMELGIHQVELDALEEELIENAGPDHVVLKLLTMWRQRTPGQGHLKLGMLIPALYKINRADLVADMGKCFKNEESGSISNDLFWEIAKGFSPDESQLLTLEKLISFANDLGFDEEETEDTIKRLFPDGSEPKDAEEWADVVFSVLLLWKESNGKNASKSHMFSSLLGAIDMAGKVSLAQKLKRKYLFQKMKSKDSLNSV